MITVHVKLTVIEQTALMSIKNFIGAGLPRPRKKACPENPKIQFPDE